MPRSKAPKRAPPTTVAQFLKALPPERAKEMAIVRAVIKRNLPKGYEEVALPGMIAYQVPLSRHSDTYNGKALWLAALAAPKSYLTLHLMPVYGSNDLEKKLRDGFKAAGKKLDIGKACIHYRKADDLALDVIGEIVAALPVERWVEMAIWARRR